jgi:hypothetical protein
MTVRLRFAARDPGGANVLAAFLRSAWFRAPSPPDIWTMPHATARFHGVSGRIREFALDASPDIVQAAWREDPADLLVTATSHYEPFESVLWQEAAAAGVPALALLDQWMNLGPRFARGRPSFAGALDDAQARDLAAIGFPADAVVVIGHPWLAEVRRRAQSLEPVRVAQGMEPGERTVRVMFVSEPIASDVAAGYNRPFGFDEFDSFRMLHAAAASAARSGQRAELVIRCHPYEDPRVFERRLQALERKSGVSVRFSTPDEPALARVLWADLVCGIGSTLLLEAMVVGRPVVSLQPGLSRENVFVATERGWADTLTDPDSREVLESLLTQPEQRARLLERHLPLARTADDRAGAAIHDWLDRCAFQA